MLEICIQKNTLTRPHITSPKQGQASSQLINTLEPLTLQGIPLFLEENTDYHVTQCEQDEASICGTSRERISLLSSLTSLHWDKCFEICHEEILVP